MSAAVVVASHRRPLRLRWLLNALSEQEADFETVVAYDAGDEETAALLAAHPLGPRAVAVAERSPAAKRNRGWRETEAQLIVFTDDDCRPPAGWLPALMEAAAAHPGALVQGATRPDPDELALFHRAPHARSLAIDPVHPMGQTCNLAYPRAVLEAIGGFDESFPDALGEDTDLVLRAQRTGATVVAAPDALTYHAVTWGLRPSLRAARRWQIMPRVVRDHPQLRAVLPLGGYAAKPAHPRWALAALGLLLRRPVLAVPWILGTARRYGTGPRGLARTAAELPGTFLIDGAETVAVLRGAVRHLAPLL